MRRVPAFVACGALGVSLAGCWPQPGQGPDRTAYNPFESALTSTSVSDLQLRWSADLGDGIVGSPCVAPAGIHASVTVGPNLDLASYSPGGQLRWRQRLWTDPGLGLMTSF